MRERWKPVPGYNGKYMVSNLGGVFNAFRGRKLNPFKRSKKLAYLAVRLVDDTGHIWNHSIHQLVMLVFKGPRPEGLVIHHKDFNGANNNLNNLKYCTQSVNKKADFDSGRQTFLGEKNNQSILTERQVLKIIELRRSERLTYAQLASKYKVSVSGVSNIFNGHTWSHITNIKNKCK